MKLHLLPVLVLLGLTTTFTTTQANASEVPRCWKADQPKADILDGIFSITIATQGKSATDIASILFGLQGAMVTQVGVGSFSDLNSIQIEEKAYVQDWRPSGGFPTLDSLKTYVLSTLEPTSEIPGVTISCVKEVHPVPDPGGSVSN